MTPFFDTLMQYDFDANRTWACTGHQGGQMFMRHPAGHLFYDHMGEAVFREDICNAMVSLGDLLIHEGPCARGAAVGREDLRRGPHVFRSERHVELEQGRQHGAPDQQGRRAVRPQQPQVEPPRRAPLRRRDPGLPRMRPQRVRHGRPDRLGCVRREEDPRAHQESPAPQGYRSLEEGAPDPRRDHRAVRIRPAKARPRC